MLVGGGSGEDPSGESHFGGGWRLVSCKLMYRHCVLCLLPSHHYTFLPHHTIQAIVRDNVARTAARDAIEEFGRRLACLF